MKGTTVQYEVEETAGYLIYRVGRLLRLRAAQFFRARGVSVTPEQWGLLLQIAERGDPAMGDLVDGTVNDHPNVSRMVTGLERLGYVTRTRGAADGRSRVVAITPEGRALIDRLLPDLLEEKIEYFRDLDQEDVAGLVQSLKKVMARLDG